MISYLAIIYIAYYTPVFKRIIDTEIIYERTETTVLSLFYNAPTFIYSKLKENKRPRHPPITSSVVKNKADLLNTRSPEVCLKFSQNILLGSGASLTPISWFWNLSF